MTPKKRKFQQKIITRRIAFLFSASTFSIVQVAWGTNTTYVGPNNGDFLTPGDWSTGIVPNSGDVVYVGPDEGFATSMNVNFNFTSADYSGGGFNELNVDSPSTSQNMTVTESPSAATNVTLETAELNMGVNSNTTGTFVQGGTNATANTISQGINVGGTLQSAAGPNNLNCAGAYKLTDPSGSINAGYIAIGGQNSEFTQTAGSVTAGYLQLLDTDAPGSDQYNMSGGTLTTTGYIAIAFGSLFPGQQGTFSQTGGIVTIASPSNPGSLAITNNSQYSLSTTSGVATLQLNGNLICTSYSGGDGFTQTGGTSTITGNVELSSTGYDFNSSTEVWYPAYASFGSTASCTIDGSLTVGTACNFTQNGGSVTVAGAFVLSPATIVEAGSATFSSGSLTVGTLNTNGVPANFTWTGGTLELTGQPLDFNSPASDSDAPLGNSLTLASGQNLTVEAYEWLNGSGATVSQASGSTNICTDLYLGDTNVGASYQLNTGATLTTTYSPSGYQYIGYEGGDGATDTFQQFGGANNSNDLYIGYSDNAIGTYSQTGGTDGVSANLYLAYSGGTQGTYTLGGGTLTAENAYVGGTNGDEAGGKGTLNISGSGQMTVDNTLLIYGNGNGNTVNIMSGSLDVLGSTINEASITQTGGASQLGAVTGIGSIALGQSSGKPTTMTVQSIVQSSVSIGSTGTLTILTNTLTTTNSVNSLSITGSGVLNLTNNHLFIDYGTGTDPDASIAAFIKSGYNGGNWNGPGIISSTAQSPTKGLRYGVGWADSKDGVVSGLSSSQIEIKYTLLGDANLDGFVNGSDFSILAANFGLGYTNWDQGNFLFTPTINGADFSALAANFGQGDSGADVAVSQADIAALDAFAVANDLAIPAVRAVPEPTTAAMIVAGITVLARRRRGLLHSGLTRHF
jgi:hypothetical protein